MRVCPGLLKKRYLRTLFLKRDILNNNNNLIMMIKNAFNIIILTSKNKNVM